MTLVQWAVLGIAVLALAIIFVCLIREQITNREALHGMLAIHSTLMDQHDRILEHLMIASDPDAWRVKQVDNFRKERHAEEMKKQAEEQPDLKREGVD